MLPGTGRGDGRQNHQNLEATSLFCPRCRKAQPVRRRLLLVLPTGEKYSYLCAVCGEEVGSKTETGPINGVISTLD
ncbi:MAG: hypothetical protein K9K65_06790 [Desulfarculaceae bacterium]|nr:hypothetical protein [Desulfarculaceae bacterium]MCF8048508.1 hypothetical protein [Desulfarculaceae bacterium]MCF8065916.1 hypothetical protein [Desulfarculaceae bacterium]MCF8097534.1 hypothetical protein [Desulfarculaceae bacterium]MCF8122219.1 hypothetical protein [Desulfarculaceae bacterium]